MIEAEVVLTLSAIRIIASPDEITNRSLSFRPDPGPLLCLIGGTTPPVKSSLLFLNHLKLHPDEVQLFLSENLDEMSRAVLTIFLGRRMTPLCNLKVETAQAGGSCIQPTNLASKCRRLC